MDPRDDLGSAFGKLERRVLEALWRRDDDTSVRDLQPDFPDTAYTTLMTTLDRLHRKGVLERIKAGRAFLYRPKFGAEQLRVRLAERTLRQLLTGHASAWRPVLSTFVEAVSRHDRELLDELEQLIREKQQASRARRTE
jgi:predicted transcriptional regulator